MGGHIQFGTFNSLTEVIAFWHLTYIEYHDNLGLCLEYGQVTYLDSEHVFKLSMRFSK